ncbi:SitI3 family protein [Streptomyces sp. NPDC020490]|uniref:SitI3 family protein n=1 Tax=Streptomyces sp. NPDC020490 TaxID=3365078 RepID=UPI00379DCA83
MAIEYDLDCATDLSANEVAAHLEEVGKETGVLDASVTAERLVEGAATRRGTWITVVTPRPPQPWHPIVIDLGFAPTVDVAFRMDKGVEVSDQQDDMIRLVAPLLRRVDGDAVLHFQFEQVWLLRRNGELSLSEEDDLWRPGRLSLMTQPYHRETHIMDSLYSD